MRLDNFVMLGKTVPEESKKYGTRVCSAGYSLELDCLVRIYPLGVTRAPARWTINRVDVERNPTDSRHESWALAGRSNSNPWTMNNAFTTIRKLAAHEQTELMERIDSRTADSIAEANERRDSLALIRPASVGFRWVPTRPGVADDAQQLELFADLAEHRDPTPYLPRIEFTDEAGSHSLQVRDWGAYELIRKRGYSYAIDHLESALQLDNHNDDIGLLVGNMNNHRTSWLVISVITGLSTQAALFDPNRVTA